MIRSELFADGNSLGKRIHASKTLRPPYVIVLGDKETESQMLTVETRSGEKLSLSQEEFLSKLKTEIDSRS